VPDVDVALDEWLCESRVPVTSTLWPTCLLRSLSDPSSLYVFAIVLVLPVVPAVPVVALVGGVVGVVPEVVPAVDPEPEALPIVAFARMNPPLVEAPAVLVGELVLLAELSCRQPVTVTVLLSVLLLVEVLGVCAINAADVANAIAAVIHKVRFIYPPGAH
jgi:hypothetical protein